MMESLHLSSRATSVVLSTNNGMPEILYLGGRLDSFRGDLIGQPVPKAVLDAPAPLGIITENGTGFLGRPGLVGSRPDGSAWSPIFVPAAAPMVGERTATFSLVDDEADLAIVIEIAISLAETVTVRVELANNGDTPYQVVRLAPSIPIPAHGGDLLTFAGRWCREFQPERTAFSGLTVIENRKGRTSHDRLPAIFAGSASFSEQQGDVWGVQLSWSGNYEVAAEQLRDGRRHVQAGELLSPGELVLAPGEVYVAPSVVVAWSESGLTHASQAFHRHVRLHHELEGPRPVILNTWEAVYFDHDLDTLKELAEVAADVGVERFVLDDGWFGSRRDDTRGLGDWWVSADVWPNGLHPIVDHVRSLGMQFGLWVEPEMVSPDSDLFRKHPEWALTTKGYEPVLGRQQLVLDCGREEVRDYLFEHIDALLREYPIAYLKWDMNRDLVQGSSHGHAGAHGHVIGLYELVDRLTATHPSLEIESCASGGGRADLEILRRTERIWTSDCNDALDRQSIQRGFSMLFPPEVMGAHIGPDRAHTTNRTQDLSFRAATALFGHLGIEWNLLDADVGGLERVAAAVGLHKRLRPLLHAGDVVRVDHPDPAALVHGVVSVDRHHAVMAYVQLTPSLTSVPLSMRFAGLAPDCSYRVTMIDDLGSAFEFGRSRPPWMATGPDGSFEPSIVSGAQLMRTGLQPPVLHPESVFLVELQAVE